MYGHGTTRVPKKKRSGLLSACVITPPEPHHRWFRAGRKDGAPPIGAVAAGF